MKKIMVIVLASILVMAGCAKDSSTGNEALDGDLKLESNQSLVIAQVTAIYGNEITLALATEVDESEMKQQREEQGDENTTDQAGSNQDTDATAEAGTEETASNSSTENGNQSANNETSSSDTTSGEVANAERPSGDMPSGDMPSGQNGSGDANGGESGSEDGEKESQSVTRYTLTGEELTATIPVGTPVTTLLGTVTTFSRIAVDNTLQIVMQKNDAGEDVIVAIYIVG